MSTSFTPELLSPSEQDLATFEALFRDTSAIGATQAGGLHRLAASAEDGAVRDVFAGWLTERGFEVRVDAVGNMFGLITFNPDAPYVLCGSHLDSQPSAGRFDGVYGVLAGAVAVASVARQLRERGEVPACNLAVVNWTNEEGARFQPSLIGSSVFTGDLALQDAWAQTENNQLIFRTKNNTPISPRNLLRHFHETLAELNIPRVPFHSLRHSYVSLLLAKNTPPRDVQALAGHASFAITMKTYGHLMPGYQQSAARKLDGLV